MRVKNLTSDAIARFHEAMYEYYHAHARDLPWRKTTNPYHILVSEIMLQQTQVTRVIGKYGQFITAFPDISSLDNAPLHQIIAAWQGLGYNRRALALKQIAHVVVTQWGGIIPSSPDALMMLPGVGRATASAIAVFAYQQPALFIETNIRAVFLYFFFRRRKNVRDAEILPLVHQTLDASNPREWYYALMDYGVMLKRTHPDLQKKSAHYHKQAPFQNSDRQIRGRILKVLVKKSGRHESEIVSEVGVNSEKVRRILIQLQKEGFIKSQGATFTLA